MLTERPVQATLPAADMERARAFYEGTLGFTPMVVTPGGVIYEAGDGTAFTVFPTSGKASGSHTQAAWRVTDIEADVADLKGRGVTFEDYDLPDFKTEGGIVTFPTTRAAWFRDSEGNLLGLIQFAEPV